MYKLKSKNFYERVPALKFGFLTARLVLYVLERQKKYPKKNSQYANQYKWCKKKNPRMSGG